MATRSPTDLSISQGVAKARPAAMASVGSVLVFLPALLLFYSALLPVEIRVNIAGANLYPSRLMALALLPWVIHRTFRSPIRLNICDFAVFASSFWMIFAFAAYYGPASGLARGLALGADVALPYLFARICVRNLVDFRRFLVLAAPGLLIAGGTMLLEVLAGRPLIRPAFASIFGNVAAYSGGVEVGVFEYATESRLGIIRASGPFSHPILAGLFLASALPLYLWSGLRHWPYFAGLAASALTVLSASSAPFLSLIVASGLLMIDWLQRIVTFLSWKLIIPLAAAALFILHLGTENGLIPLLTQFTLDPTTAYFRQLIWRFGTESVANNPWIGIGHDSYERPTWMLTDSVDNHWLLLAMRFGLFPAIAMLFAVLVSLYSLSKTSVLYNETDRRSMVGVAIAVFSFSLLGFSVAFFGGAQTWFYLLLGMSVGLGYASVRRPVRVQLRSDNRPGARIEMLDQTAKEAGLARRPVRRSD